MEKDGKYNDFSYKWLQDLQSSDEYFTHALRADDFVNKEKTVTYYKPFAIIDDQQIYFGIPFVGKSNGESSNEVDSIENVTYYPVVTGVYNIFQFANLLCQSWGFPKSVGGVQLNKQNINQNEYNSKNNNVYAGISQDKNIKAPNQLPESKNAVFYKIEWISSITCSKE